MNRHARPVSLGILVFALSGAGCATDTPGGQLIYDRSGETPVLWDTEIVLESMGGGRQNRVHSRYILRCEGGVISTTVDTPHVKGTGTMGLGDYGDIWRELESDNAGWRWTMEPVDPQGNVYHIVKIRRGPKVNQFSAQRTPLIFGFYSSSEGESIDFANLFAKKVRHFTETTPVVHEPPAPAPDGKADR